MANSRKVKKIHICSTCKGNGYVKIQNIYDIELQVHQCWDCDSEGEFVEYVEEQERVLN
jgi:DnaJ-class molecular chaperone